MHLNASFLVVLFLLGLLFVVGNKRNASSPRYRARQLLTDNETEFFHRLRRALPEEYVFPQVAMSALIEPRSRTKERIGEFNRISQKRVDFAIYSGELRLLAVVELDDRTHHRGRDAARDAALASAAIRTIRFQSTRKPTEAEIRLALFPNSDAPVDRTKPRSLTLVN